MRFEVLHPPASYYRLPRMKTNDLSCVVRVSSGHGRALLTGDIEARSEVDLVRHDPDALRAEVLVVPHHGSITSSTPAFIGAVAPDAAVFTPGYRNRFGHPRPEVVARYEQFGAALHRTDRDGALTFSLRAGRRPRAARRAQPPGALLARARARGVAARLNAGRARRLVADDPNLAFVATPFPRSLAVAAGAWPRRRRLARRTSKADGPPEVTVSVAVGPAFPLGAAAERWATLITERVDKAFVARLHPGATLAQRDPAREFAALQAGKADLAVGVGAAVVAAGARARRLRPALARAGDEGNRDACRRRGADRRARGEARRAPG